jgi:uncharacterized protein YyaL (SSP411 family)
MSGRRKNRLAKETSPYLLQHATNPVDWFPWGDEALSVARERNVPIFLSVGYAACHWCHVMERESFEDQETASFLNAHFVSIKVDREERPDVDAVYMDAVQAMTGSGGWPMSVFLTPDGRPFYAGTYFPDQPRHGMPSFRQVLEGLTDAWATRRSDVEAQGAGVTAAIGRATGVPDGDVALHESVFEPALSQIASTFDGVWGGFGAAPKFPQPMILGWLLRQSARGRTEALEMVTTTLDRMADGGIHDQLGGGFARYSTDHRWHVPHFEKMLSDNAQLTQLYAEAWLATGHPRYRDVSIRTADYLLRELRTSDGGFASSQDADSEGQEGRYYVWDYRELTEAVGASVAVAFGARPEGNWDGTNVLWVPRPIGRVADEMGIDAHSFTRDIDAARRTLLGVRTARVPPALDDKTVTAWNGLAIRALSIAGRTFDEPRLIEAATAAASFVWDAMRGPDGRLRRSWRAGRSSVPGFLDDHALLGLGLLTLYETTGDETWFTCAVELAQVIVERFARPDGGFFLTADDADGLVVRPTDVVDAATPSGTAASAELLVRLSRYTGDQSLEDKARAAIHPLVAQARRHPASFGHALAVADLLIGPTREVAVVGDRRSAAAVALIDQVFSQRYLPNVVTAIGVGDAAPTVVPLLTGRTPIEGMPTAYVCERFTCRLPTSDPAVLASQLKG